jgi:signal transduction histidine kinase
VRFVPRSEPTFRRRLLFAWALFIALFVADLVLIGQLAFGDLSHRVIDRAFRASLGALELQGPPPLPGGEGVLPGPVEPCPPASPQSPVHPGSCSQASPRPTPGLSVFRSILREQILIGLKGEVLHRSFVQISRREVGRPGRSPLRPGHPEIPEVWDVAGQRRPVVALSSVVSPGSSQVKEVGIPADLIEQELAQLQRELQMKLWIGAGAAVLILLVAFLYVLRLLHRTRLLEAQAQMDDRLAFVGALAAGLAHEIRNPLNVLSMNLQMLEEEIAARAAGAGGQAGGPMAQGADDVRTYIGALQAEIRRLSSLVNNFLTYARPHQPRFETRDLNQVLRDVALLLRREFETRGLTLKLDLPPYLPPVDLDEALIRQAVMNVLINATQILKEGGTVTVQSRVGAQGEAIVTIDDDGPGIRPEDRRRIFEVFYSGRGGGTGLGLPIAARIIEAHGGSIVADAAPGGRGARFILTLPRRHLGEAAPAAPAGVPAPEAR